MLRRVLVIGWAAGMAGGAQLMGECGRAVEALIQQPGGSDVVAGIGGEGGGQRGMGEAGDAGATAPAVAMSAEGGGDGGGSGTGGGGAGEGGEEPQLLRSVGGRGEVAERQWGCRHAAAEGRSEGGGTRVASEWR